MEGQEQMMATTKNQETAETATEADEAEKVSKKSNAGQRRSPRNIGN